MKPDSDFDRELVAVVGAGDLVSYVYRASGQAETPEYYFNLARIGKEDRVVHQLRACDLRDVVKLCQVLAFAIVDDGWSDGPTKSRLLTLNAQLDGLTAAWEGGGDE